MDLFRTWHNQASVQLVKAWLDDTSTPVDDPRFLVVLPRLERLGVVRSVLQLAVHLWSQPPLRLPALSSVAALELAMLIYERGIGNPSSVVRTAEQARLVFVGCHYRTEAEAALTALDVVPDARRNLRPWQIDALRDFEHSDTPATVLAEAHLALRNTAPGADYAEVGELCWVVWRLSTPR